MESLPITAMELVDELDMMYPEKCPDIKDSEREIWFKAGQRSVVNHLLYLKEQAEETLDTTVIKK